MNSIDSDILGYGRWQVENHNDGLLHPGLYQVRLQHIHVLDHNVAMKHSDYK